MQIYEHSVVHARAAALRKDCIQKLSWIQHTPLAPKKTFDDLLANLENKISDLDAAHRVAAEAQAQAALKAAEEVQAAQTAKVVHKEITGKESGLSSLFSCCFGFNSCKEF